MNGYLRTINTPMNKIVERFKYAIEKERLSHLYVISGSLGVTFKENLGFRKRSHLTLNSITRLSLTPSSTIDNLTSTFSLHCKKVTTIKKRPS